MLANKPVAPGPSITDRKAWKKLSERPSFQRIVKSATEKLKQKLPKMTDELYLEFSKNGNRTHWQDANGKYSSRLSMLVLAECLENKGTFLSEIENLIKHFCESRTWVMPAHDRNLSNFKGKQIDIDLGAAMFGWSLATIDAMLEDKLKPSTRKLIRENLEKRIYTPFEEMVKANKNKNWWLTGTNNWNAVCLAGVVGSALPIIDTPERRAFFIASAEQYIENFLKGFTPDGNCSEGLGYWNYGFGHFIMLSETIAQSTDGKLQLMDNPKAFKPALYGFRAEIQDRVYPALADCGVGSRPDPNLQIYINNYYGLGMKDQKVDQYEVRGSLYSMMLYAALTEKKGTSFKGKTKFDFDPLRSWFPDAGIYIGRKDSLAKNKLAVACKGGNNAEHHNHNDIGTFIVVVDDEAVLCDPGSEVYTARTFSKNRYKSKVLNSFGHPVPLIAGKLQQPGADRQGKIIRKSFTKDQDEVVFDLKSAYSVSSLKKLEREFAYLRKGQGILTVSDSVEFDKPQTYETALITFGNWFQNKDGSLFIYNHDKAVNVTIDAGGKDFDISSEILDEDVQAKTLPTRIGFKLKEPVNSAKFAITVIPAEIKEDGNLLKNGNFEHHGFAWEIPNPGMGKITEKQAYEGKFSLKISDNDKKKGSDISSGKIPVDKPGKFILKGKYFPVSGKGLGMYVKYFDGAGKMLNKSDEKGHISSVGDLGGKSNKWQDFSFSFKTPKDTKFIKLWIHSYVGSQVEGYLDAMEVREE